MEARPLVAVVVPSEAAAAAVPDNIPKPEKQGGRNRVRGNRVKENRVKENRVREDRVKETKQENRKRLRHSLAAVMRSLF
ncbi:MAG: hypothetical protein PHE02_03560 [Lachnospiraceae bacterium]|nr:hypothetical protein [Lachnospiraceae bacterium]